MKAAAAIGEYKKQNGLPVYDAVREENKLEAVAKTAAETCADGKSGVSLGCNRLTVAAHRCKLSA